jgi:parvulin-like peptidyl-prolyl isomerase
MKSVALSVIFASLACAQIPSAATPPPAGTAQPPAAAVAPDTVVAEVDGKKYTAAEVDKLLALFPPDPQTAARVRAQPRQALQYILLMRHLADEALKAKLDQESPLKEQLELQRMVALGQAEISKAHNVDIQISGAEAEKYYKDNPDKFQEAKVKIIYVAFTMNPVTPTDPKAKKPLAEPEAKEKAEDLRKKALAGADFGALAKENSDDRESANKDGDFPPIKHTSSYPEPVKKAVFALKPGEISEPVRMPNGYYVIRLERLAQQPYQEVSNQIFEDLRKKQFDQWMSDLQKRFEVKAENPAYFTGKPAPPAPPSH